MRFQDASDTQSELGDVVEHRPISRLSVIAVMLALAAPLALAMPLLWLVPLIGALASGLALWFIARDERRPYGRIAAALSLAVCLFVLAFAPTHYLVHRRIVVQQGQKHATEWLRLVIAGQRTIAHQLTLPFDERVGPGTDLELVYSQVSDAAVTDPMLAAMSPSRATSLAKFFQRPAVRELAEVGKDAEPRFVGVSQFALPAGTTDLVQFRYDVDYEAGGTSHTLPLLISLERARAEGRVVWRVSNVDKG